MKLEFSITGPEAFSGLMEAIGANAAPTGLRSLLRSGEAIMTVSKEQYVPVDTGTLRSSGNVQGEIQGNEVVVHLGYGGAASNYAVFVHEIQKKYKGGKQYKYLETPLKASIGDIERSLVDDFNAMLSGR